MNTFGLTFDHLGLAVRKPDKALRFLEASGYKATGTVYDGEQNVNLIMCTSDTMPNVELIFPGESKGPVHKILERVDSGIYHMCFSTARPQESIDQMKTGGLRVVCLSPPKPAILFQGRMVSFYNVIGFGVIELIEAEGVVSDHCSA